MSAAESEGEKLRKLSDHTQPLMQALMESWHMRTKTADVLQQTPVSNSQHPMRHHASP